MNRIARFAMTAAVSVGLTAGTAMTVGAAQAQGPSYQGGNCPPGVTCTHWLPGQPPPPGGQVLTWDWNVPHDWYWNSDGIVDVTTNTMYPWNGSGARPATPPPAPQGPPAPPLQKPPGTPFCSPRGSLIIIPPICDEIGVDWPPGSLKR